MTRGVFYQKNGRLVGFEIDGHTGFARLGSDVVCAAISSAAYMTANTVTEVCGAKAAVDEESGRLRVMLEDDVALARCRDILEGFLLHMTQLAAQYPRNLTMTTTELPEP